MKKVLALVLAVVLAFGMSSVAFGALIGNDSSILDDATTGEGYLPITKDLVPGTSYKISALDYWNALQSAGKAMVGTDEHDLLNKDTSASVVWKEGGYMVASFGKKKNTTAGITNIPVDTYYTELKMANNYTLTDAKDLKGTITLKNKVGSKTVKSEFKFEYSVTHETNEWDAFDTAKESKEDGNVYIAEKNIVAKVTNKTGYVSFGDARRLILITAKAKKDQKIYGYFEETPIAAIVEKYENIEAKIACFSFEAQPEFDKAEVVINSDFAKKPFIYEYKDGKLTEIKDAKWNNADGTYTFNTTKLTAYVLSDKELVSTADAGTGTTNPDTGANDFVGLAVALAVVSIAGIAVAKRK